MYTKMESVISLVLHFCLSCVKWNHTANIGGVFPWRVRLAGMVSMTQFA